MLMSSLNIWRIVVTKLIVNEKLIGSYEFTDLLAESLNKILLNEEVASMEYHQYIDASEIEVRTKFFVLQQAVKKLYYAGKWRCDLSDTESQKLWEDVRNAAGLEPGHSPKG